MKATKILKVFKSTCNGQPYTYKLVESGDEYKLYSFSDTIERGFLTWDKSDTNLVLINAACVTMQARV